MRLIDADPVIEQIDAERDILVKDGRLGTEHILVHYVREFIEDAPTIDRPQGEWIDTTSGEHWKCSSCGSRASFFLYDGNKAVEWLSEYCPNCGARMKGVSDDA